MFSGSFQTMDLGEVLRLLASSSQTGVLRILEDEAIGAVYLQLGAVVHAETGLAQGLDALAALAERMDAAFAFDAGETVAPGRSLAEIPTGRLVETLRGQLDKLRAVRESMPGPEDVVAYQPGVQATGLQATPRDLSLLLLADGVRTVSEIAAAAGMSLESVRAVLGRFRRAGMIEIVEAGRSGASGQPEPAPEAPEGREAAGAPLYWRGKRIR